MGRYTILSKRGLVPQVGKAEKLLLKEINLDILYIERKAREFLKEITPIRTGFMASRIKTWGTRLGAVGGFSFFLGWKPEDAPYSGYVDEGSGIYGKHKSPIVPVHALMLAWDDDGVWKRAYSVKGQKPQYLFSRVVEAWSDWFLEYLEKKRVATWRKVL